MKTMLSLCLMLSLCISTTATYAASKQDKAFAQYVKQLRIDAKKQGISNRTIKKYLYNLKAPVIHPLFKLKHQLQQSVDFDRYYKQMVPKKSLELGRYNYRKYYSLLKRIQRKYDVQPRFIIALWGFESYYGKNMGNSPIIKSLVTLAYQRHRTDFYRTQLFAALKMLDQKKVIPQQKISTWDGGMGLIMFEPDIYWSDAVDFDGDGFKNIWTSKKDALASVANYLHRRGWNGKQSWGFEVRLPKKFDEKLIGVKNKKTMAEWRKLGVLTAKGRPIANSKEKAALIRADKTSKKVYLVYHNFDVLLRWNNIVYEALSIGLMSDYIAKR